MIWKSARHTWKLLNTNWNSFGWRDDELMLETNLHDRMSVLRVKPTSDGNSDNTLQILFDQQANDQILYDLSYHSSISNSNCLTYIFQ